jgi:hypothetical protein
MTPFEDPAIHRFAPGRAFPAYTFVPGRAPHPESDPAGHSFGVARPCADPATPASWRTNETYLYGLDLFNAGFYWEAHVEFESLWHASGREGPTARFLKGLIRLAAAGVKRLEGNAAGVRSHARGAGELFRGVAGREEWFLGLRLSELAALAEGIEREGWPARPPILWPAPAG